MSSPRTAHPPASLPVDSPERRRLPPTLRRAWYSLNQAFRRRLAPLGITPDQFTALRILLEGDARGLTQRQLTHIMSSDPNTVASLVKRMEQGGLVKRRPHEQDRRAHRIHLQSVGHKKYEAARVIAVQLQSEVLSVLPLDRREDFLEHLACVAEACRQAAAKPSASRSGRGHSSARGSAAACA